MNAVRRDPRSHYISMTVDRYVANNPGAGRAAVSFVKFRFEIRL
jgi:hypothetical protein